MKKKLLLGVCGSVGSISLAYYISVLVQYYSIKIIFSENSQHFVQYKGFLNIVDGCYVNEFSEFSPLHISLAQEADVFILLPASANTISKMAHGIADNLLTSTLLAYSNKVYIAANMNYKMWLNPIFQDNIEYLKSKGHVFINERGKAMEVSSGEIIECEACMPSIENLIKIIEDA